MTFTDCRVQKYRAGLRTDGNFGRRNRPRRARGGASSELPRVPIIAVLADRTKKEKEKKTELPLSQKPNLSQTLRPTIARNKETDKISETK